MGLAFSDQSNKVTLVHSNKTNVSGKLFDGRLHRPEQVFAQLEKNSLKAKGSVEKFPNNEKPLWNRVFSEKGVEVDHQKMQAPKKIKSPSNLRQLRAVLLQVGFYCNVFPAFARTFEPPFLMLKKGKKFSWTQQGKIALTK